MYDADTFKINLACQFEVLCKEIPVRAKGFDAAEMRGDCASEKALALKARTFTIEALKVGNVTLHNPERGKYFRIAADVHINGHPLADMIIEAGLARPYAGGKRRGWCD